jgi:ABC-type bacteriocin/lantibiotic exporter with double-glycine peptidase domain
MKKTLFCLLITTLFFPSCGLRNGPLLPDFSSFDVFIPVNFHAQKDDTTCGLAAIEMIADYYGKTLDARFSGLLLKEAKLLKGIQAASLKACLEASGFDVAVFPGTFDRETPGIYRHMDLKRPLIVLISEKPKKNGHYLIANGYKGAARLALINPEKGQLDAGIPWFLTLWKNSGNLAILALPSKK